MLPQHLIERALVLTGKNLQENDFSKRNFEGNIVELSIEKFCYYLLSPEFIEKYAEIYFSSNKNAKPRNPIGGIITKISHAINKYQKGNEEHLISLLSKIGTI